MMEYALILLPVVLLVLLFAGVPIYAAFLVCNVGAVALLMGWSGVGLFANSITNSATNGSLIAIPLFILMGDILYRGNAIDALVRSADTLIGNLRGRHYILSIIVSTILATLSGSQMASSAVLSRTVYPMLAKRGYDTNLSLGVIIGGACLAPIIPPSIVAIVISTIAQISVADLFVAGFIPGILIATLMFLYIVARIAANPALAPDSSRTERPKATDYVSAVGQLMPFALVIGLVIGSIMFGIATPGESACIGVLCAIGVAAWFRKLSVAMLLEALSSTVVITAMIMAIVVSSQLFSQLLSFTGASQTLSELVNRLSVHGGVMLFIMMLIPFVVCMVLDEMAVMLILIPIYNPLLPALDFDPIWFWTLFLVNITLGGIVPPVGYVLFVMKGILNELTIGQLYRASLPFVAIYLFAMTLMAIFPDLVLFLL